MHRQRSIAALLASSLAEVVQSLIGFLSGENDMKQLLQAPMQASHGALKAEGIIALHAVEHAQADNLQAGLQVV